MWSPDPTNNHIEASSNLTPSYLPLAFNCLKGNEKILKKMFENQDPNPQGLYMVKIFQGSVWKSIIIDDYIPVIE